MAKFHIGRGGKAAACSARKGKCPYGSDDEHFSSRETAQFAAEDKMANENSVLSSSKKPDNTTTKKIDKNEKTNKNNPHNKTQKAKLPISRSKDYPYLHAVAVSVVSDLNNNTEYLRSAGKEVTDDGITFTIIQNGSDDIYIENDWEYRYYKDQLEEIKMTVKEEEVTIEFKNNKEKNASFPIPKEKNQNTGNYITTKVSHHIQQYYDNNKNN